MFTCNHTHTLSSFKQQAWPLHYVWCMATLQAIIRAITHGVQNSQRCVDPRRHCYNTSLLIHSHSADIRNHARERIQKAFGENPAVSNDQAHRLGADTEDGCFKRANNGGNPRSFHFVTCVCLLSQCSRLAFTPQAKGHHLQQVKTRDSAKVLAASRCKIPHRANI